MRKIFTALLCIAMICVLTAPAMVLAVEDGYTRIEIKSGTQIEPDSEHYKEETVVYDPPIQPESGTIEYNFQIEGTDYDYDGACEIFIMPVGFSYSAYDYIGEFLFANAAIHFQWIGNGNGEPHERFMAYHGIAYGESESVAEEVEAGKIYNVTVQIKPDAKTYSVTVKQQNGVECGSLINLNFVDGVTQNDFSSGIGSVVVLNAWESGMNAYVDVPSANIAAVAVAVEEVAAPAEVVEPVAVEAAPAPVAPAPVSTPAPATGNAAIIIFAIALIGSCVLSSRIIKTKV